MRTKRILSLVALVAVLMAGCAGAAPVFKTPEDAITRYFEGLAQHDYQKIAQAAAINEMSEKFKFDAYTDRLRAFIPVQSQAPAEYPLYVEINKAQLSGQFFNRVKIFAYSLLSTENVADGSVIALQENETDRINQFIKDVAPQGLAGLELKDIGLPGKQLLSSAKYLENAAKLAAVYGADESTERLALFSFKGQEFYVGFSLLRYGDNWKISSQVSNLAGTSALGEPVKTTAQEFENLTNGE